MIDVYMWTTTNSRRATVGLEEAGLEYTAHPVNIQEGEQKTPEHTALNPYQKVPAIIDPDGPDGKPITVFESGAILLYAAEKTGTLYGANPRDKVTVQSWFALHLSGSLPILGALRQNPPMLAGAQRILGVIDSHLADHEFFAPDFSIADLAFYPRIANWAHDSLSMEDYPNIMRWRELVGARPAVQRGWAQPKI